MNKQETRSFSSTLWTLLAVWLSAAVVAGYIGVFATGTRFSMSVPLPLGIAAVLPLAVLVIWSWVSQDFREHLLHLNPVILSAAQTWRLGGVVFLILMSKGLLPAAFALPAGLGDMAIGITAPLIALALSRNRLPRWVYVLWQVAGITDLVVAVGTGVLSSDPRFGFVTHGPSTSLMGQLPLSLIPTFLVPLLGIFHLISLAQVRQRARVNSGWIANSSAA